MTQQKPQKPSKFTTKNLITVGIFLMIMLILSACSTLVPVAVKFPEPPKYATERCPQLQKLNNDAKLSDVATTVTINYSTYYEIGRAHV